MSVKLTKSDAQAQYESLQFNVVLGSFDGLPIFDNLVSRKRLVEEGNFENFGLRGKHLLYSDYF